MTLVIVPDSLRDAINTKLDAEITKHPDAACDREIFYQFLLSYFFEHGELPEFHLEPKETAAKQPA